jgi:hypothetical protein
MEGKILKNNALLTIDFKRTLSREFSLEISLIFKALYSFA